MQLNTLKFAAGSIKLGKRVGRGQGSGKGGTSAKGHKGAKSRSGYKTKIGFEGGQLPLQRRIPMYGFKNPGKIVYKPISLATLQQLSEKAQLTVIDKKVLAKHSLISKRERYKVLSSDSFQSKLEVAAHAFSATAIAAIERVGGRVIRLNTHE